MNRTTRRLPIVVVCLAVASSGTAMAGVGAVLLTGPAEPDKTAAARRWPSGRGPGGVPAGPGGGPGTQLVAPLGRVVPPDVLAVAGRPVGSAELARIQKLGRVRDVITMDAGQVRLGGREANVLGVDPGRFRSWTPPDTAKQEQLWSALARDHFVIDKRAGRRLGLRAGGQYPIVARTSPYVTMGGSASLGVPGVDLLVSRRTGAQIGLVRDLGVMVNAPGADAARLSREMRKILGKRSQVLNLHDRKNQPGDTGSGRPRSYLDLYKKSATSCRGLSWTVLAAIGQIESGHGRNTGPSSAGALGPMQFLPATWRSYGKDGDGDGRADIMNPYDAVPSAARYLCATGAGQGGQRLYQAIWHYNHSDEYVRNVLTLAQAYARTY